MVKDAPYVPPPLYDATADGACDGRGDYFRDDARVTKAARLLIDGGLQARIGSLRRIAHRLGHFWGFVI
jgi:hypothetical protein